MHSEVGQVGEQRQPLFAEWRMGNYGVHGGRVDKAVELSHRAFVKGRPIHFR